MELLEVVSVPKRRAPFIKSYSKTLPIYLVHTQKRLKMLFRSTTAIQNKIALFYYNTEYLLTTMLSIK